MPDRDDPKLPMRPPSEPHSDDRQGEQTADDPLVELARVVSRPSSIGNPSKPASPSSASPNSVSAASPDRPGVAPLPSESDLARDLEAELLNELQASFSMVPEVVNRVPQRQHQEAPQAPTPESTETEEAASRPSQATVPPAAPAPVPPSAPPVAQSNANVVDDEELLNDILSDFNDDILNLAPQQPTSASPPPQPASAANPESPPVVGRQRADEGGEAPISRPETSRINPPAQSKRASLASRIARAAKSGEQGEQEQASANRIKTPRPPQPAQRPTAPRPSRGGDRTISDGADFRPPSAAANPPRADSGTRPPRPVETRWELPPDPDTQPTFDPSRFAPISADEGDTGHPDVEPTTDDLFYEAGETQFHDETAPHDEYEAVPGYGDDELLAYPDDDLEAMQPRRSRRGPLAIAALLAILVIGGATVMYMRSGGSSGPPPIIVADASPTKITPETAATGSGDSQSKLIYDRVDPGSDAADSQLVITDNAAIADIPPIPEETTSSDVSRVILGGGPGIDSELEESGSADVGPVEDGGGTTIASSSPDPAAIGPKKVRTVVVRPDGTIVSSEAVAPEPETDAAPQVDLGETLADLPPASETPPPPGADENPLLSENFGVGENTGPASSAVPSVPAATTPSPSIPDVAPPPTPTSRPPTSNSAVVAARNNASAPPSATQGSPRPSAAGRSGNFLVQISSQRSEATALETFGELQRRYPSILGDRAANIQRADLGERGIYYRVRVGYPTREEAVRMCESLKAAGGDCLLATR